MNELCDELNADTELAPLFECTVLTVGSKRIHCRNSIASISIEKCSDIDVPSGFAVRVGRHNAVVKTVSHVKQLLMETVAYNRKMMEYHMVSAIRSAIHCTVRSGTGTPDIMIDVTQYNSWFDRLLKKNPARVFTVVYLTTGRRNDYPFSIYYKNERVASTSSIDALVQIIKEWL